MLPSLGLAPFSCALATPGAGIHASQQTIELGQIVQIIRWGATIQGAVMTILFAALTVIVFNLHTIRMRLAGSSAASSTSPARGCGD